MNNIPNSKSPSGARKNISVGTAILVGQLVVNFPVPIIILGVSSLGIIFTIFLGLIIPSSSHNFFFIGAMISVAIGSLTAWLWWSLAVPRWRKWALQNGAPEDELQKWAVLTGLVWPKGWIFEKTEFKVED